jgi:hypothetical protein
MKPLAIVALCVLAALSNAQVKSASQIALEKRIATYCRAMENKDRKTIETILAKDFTATSRVGQVADRKAVLDGLSGLFKQVKSLKIACKIQKFKLEKGNARITCLNELDVQMPGPGGKMGRLTNVTTSDEVWVLVKGVYQVKSSKQLTNVATFDGKIVTGG